MADKPSKLLAFAYGALGVGFLAQAGVMWREINGGTILPPALTGARRNGLGESLRDSVSRSNGVKLKKTIVNAPTIQQRENIIRRLIIKGSENTDVRKTSLGVLTRKTGAPGARSWQTPPKNGMAEVKAIWNAITDPNSDIAIRYTKDHAEKDTYTAAEKTLKLRAGDCDDMTIVIGAMLKSVGYATALEIIQTKGASSWSHIYLLVAPYADQPDKWVALDPTMPQKGMGWRAPDSIVLKRRVVMV